MSLRSALALRRPGVQRVEPAQREWVIEPRTGNLLARAVEVWTSRHLFSYFASRLIQRRFRSSPIRMLRSFLRPVLPLLTYTVVFNRVAGIETGETPYFLFLAGGLAVWHLLHESLLWCTRSFRMNSSILRRLYFPRIILPASTQALALVDLGIYMVILVGACLYILFTTGKFYLSFGPHNLAMFLAIFLCLYLGLAIGLFLAIFGASTPDLRFGLPYALQFWLLITPVAYPITQVPENLRIFTELNPMTTSVELFKMGLFGPSPEIWAVGIGDVLRALILTSIVFAAGLWFFGKAESASVDKL